MQSGRPLKTDCSLHTRDLRVKRDSFRLFDTKCEVLVVVNSLYQVLCSSWIHRGGLAGYNESFLCDGEIPDFRLYIPCRLIDLLSQDSSF